MDEHTPEYYVIIPEYNSAGRLCNYGSGNEPKVRVPAAEWERFNQLAGRQHEVIDGVVVYNAALEPCMPDVGPPGPDERLRALESAIMEMAGEIYG